jgi:hypothetical protein
MRTRTSFLLCLLLLAACATQQLNTGLQTLIGHNIREAMSHLGYPDGQREIMGDTIYIWSTNRSGVLPMNMPATTTGTVGGVPYSGTTTSMAFVPIAIRCTVQIAVAPDGTIKSYQWEGNEAGCKRYARGFH